VVAGLARATSSKPAEGMASLVARLGSARQMARRSPIRVTAIEAEMGTRYTLDTLRKLRAALPKTAVCMADGVGRSCAIPSLARVAHDRA